MHTNLGVCVSTFLFLLFHTHGKAYTSTTHPLYPTLAAMARKESTGIMNGHPALAHSSSVWFSNHAHRLVRQFQKQPQPLSLRSSHFQLTTGSWFIAATSLHGHHCNSLLFSLPHCFRDGNIFTVLTAVLPGNMEDETLTCWQTVYQQDSKCFPW